MVMKKAVAVLSLLVLASSPAVGRAQDSADEEARIRKQLGGWVEAWNRRDANAVAAFYTEDAIRMFPHGTVETGRASISRVYQKAFTAPLPAGVEQTLTASVRSIRLLRPDVAVVDYEYRATGLPMLPELAVTGRTTLVLLKEGGKWLRSVQSNWIPTTPGCYRQCAGN
jgi:uncharacterized protein (TIGR02246 family)